MKQLICLALIGAIGHTTVAKLSDGLDKVTRRGSHRQVLTLEHLDAELVNLAELSDAEMTDLVAQLDAYNSAATQSSQFASAEEVEEITTRYFCLGGKIAYFFDGLQGLKCIGPNRKKIVVTFNDDNGHPMTGLAAKSFFGVNVGLAIKAAMLVHKCHPEYCEGNLKWNSPPAAYHLERPTGSTVSVAFFVGAMLGFYRNESNDVSIYGLLGGFSGELSASAITITRDQDR